MNPQDCTTCGATVDPEQVTAHNAWHAEQDAKWAEATRVLQLLIDTVLVPVAERVEAETLAAPEFWMPRS